MLHRRRSVLARSGRDRLSGTVEVDETYIGGEEPGLRGGRARGKKVLTGIAVEVREPKGIGRCRMAPLAAVKESVDRFFGGRPVRVALPPAVVRELVQDPFLDCEPVSAGVAHSDQVGHQAR